MSHEAHGTREVLVHGRGAGTRGAAGRLRFGKRTGQASSSDPDYDVGFVVLQPLDGKNIEEVLGANQVGFDAGSNA